MGTVTDKKAPYVTMNIGLKVSFKGQIRRNIYVFCLDRSKSVLKWFKVIQFRNTNFDLARAVIKKPRIFKYH